MRRTHWLLPETPDVLGLLRGQLAVTREGVEAFGGWARGERPGADLREIEDRGDEAKRRLLAALRAAFVTPLEPEDLFMLSRDIDWILNGVGDLAAEAEALGYPPDSELVEMAEILDRAVREIESAVEGLGSSADRTTESADAAIALVRAMRDVYYQSMAGSIEPERRGERIARRELYRSCMKVGETVVDVAERIVYSMVKQS